MRHTEVAETLKTIICSRLRIPPDQIDYDTNLRTLEGVESIKILETVVAMETHFDVELEDDVVFTCNTIDDLARAIEELLWERQSSAVVGDGAAR